MRDVCVIALSLAAFCLVVSSRSAKIGVISDWEDVATGILLQREEDNASKMKIVAIETRSESQTHMDYLNYIYRTLSDNNVVGFVSPLVPTIAMVTENLGIPYLLTSSTTYTGARFNHTFAILVNSSMLSQALLDVTKAFDWKTMAVFYDYSIGWSTIHEFSENPKSLVKMCGLHGHDMKNMIRRYLLETRDFSIRNLIVLGTPNTLQMVFKMARRLAMVAEPYAWLAVNLDSRDIGEEVFKVLEANVTILSLPGYIKETLIMPSDLSSLEISSTADALSVLSRAISELTPGKPITPLRVAERVRQIELPGKTGIISFDHQGNRKNASLQLLRHGHGNPRQIGLWREKTSMFQQPLTIFPASAQRLGGNGYLLTDIARVVMIMEPPFCMLKKGSHNRTGNDRYEGYAVELTQRISQILRFSYEIYIVPDGKFGILQEDGLWNGIIGELLRGEATMSVAPTSISFEREKVVDFTKPFMTRGITAVTKTPASSPSYLQFMYPLSYVVWACVLFAFVITSLLLYFLEKYSSPCRTDINKGNMRESAWFVFASLVNGSSESSPITIPGRMVSSAWWFFALILISSYTANLTAFLTVKKITPPVSSVADLAYQKKIKFGTVRDSGVRQFFARSKLDHYKKMFAEMDLTNNFVDNSSHGFDKVLNEEFALLWDNTVNNYKTIHDCQFYQIGPPIDNKGFGIGVPQGALYRENLSMAILKLAEQGQLGEMENRWWGESSCPDVTKPSANSAEELNLEHVAGIFLVLIGGIFLSAIFCIIEHFLVASGLVHIKGFKKFKFMGNLRPNLRDIISENYLKSLPLPDRKSSQPSPTLPRELISEDYLSLPVEDRESPEPRPPLPHAAGESQLNPPKKESKLSRTFERFLKLKK